MPTTSPTIRTPEYWIEHLRLLAHPEGGYYRETYRSREEIPGDCLPPGFKGYRRLSTAIYFLLTAKDRSVFHRIKSDEIWHFHDGGPLNIYVLNERGLATHTLGPDPENGHQLQLVIPANRWFGAMTVNKEDYTLTSCTVSPGFDFQDFEIADRKQLLNEFPGEKEIITRLTKS